MHAWEASGEGMLLKEADAGATATRRAGVCVAARTTGRCLFCNWGRHGSLDDGVACVASGGLSPSSGSRRQGVEFFHSLALSYPPSPPSALSLSRPPRIDRRRRRRATAGKNQRPLLVLFLSHTPPLFLSLASAEPPPSTHTGHRSTRPPVTDVHPSSISASAAAATSSGAAPGALPPPPPPSSRPFVLHPNAT